MSKKQNHNTVKVEIPVEGDYILTILDYMLIVKRIFNETYQYSEFTNIADKYIMTSVNCKSGNVMRIMEDFCKSHNCPKRFFRDSFNYALNNRKEAEQRNLFEIESLTDLLNKYKSTNTKLEYELEQCKELLNKANEKLNAISTIMQLNCIESVDSNVDEGIIEKTPKPFINKSKCSIQYH